MARNSMHSIHPFGLLCAADARREGWSGALQGAARRGEVERVRPGVYVNTTAWRGMPRTDRSLARIHAADLTLKRPVFCLQSAAAVHGLPLWGPEQTHVHVLESSPGRSGRRVETTIHAYSGDPDPVYRRGLLVTSAARTVLDLARVLPHHQALALADAAIRPTGGRSPVAGTGRSLVSHEDLLERATPLVGQRGGWAAYLVASDASPLSESPGESFGRSVIMRLGAPAPELQVPVYDHEGLVGYADFAWLRYGVLAEFDGHLKYGADNPSGRDPADVVYREKLREDRMRRKCRHFIRFGWRHLERPERLARLLVDAGLPLDRRAAAADLRATVRALCG